MSYFTFPNTNYYQPDLGWLIKHVLKLMESYNNLEDIVNELKELYETIPEEIQQAVDAAMAQIRAEMDLYFKKVNDILDQIQESQGQIDEKIKDLYDIVYSINALIADTLRHANDYADFKDEILYNRIMEYLNSWSKEWPPVKCPVDNQMEDINTALEHVYLANACGVTVDELINWNVTVDDLILWGITIDDLLSHHGWYKIWMLAELPKFLTVWSSISGQRVSFQEAIDELTRFHMKGMTVQGLIDEGITVDDLINQNITVYDLAFTNQNYMTSLASGKVVDNKKGVVIHDNNTELQPQTV